MKQKNKKFKFIFLSLIIFTLLLFLLYHLKHTNIQQDLLFLKLIGNPQEQAKEEKAVSSYYFDIKNQNIDIKTVYMNNTFAEDKIMKEKIAPGVKGEFTVEIEAQKNTNYEIEFLSKKEKPKNLCFYIKEEEKYNSIEQLGKTLESERIEECQGKISIYWQWEYEQGSMQDIQDTKDATAIQSYYFDIIVTKI